MQLIPNLNFKSISKGHRPQTFIILNPYNRVWWAMNDQIQLFYFLTRVLLLLVEQFSMYYLCQIYIKTMFVFVYFYCNFTQLLVHNYIFLPFFYYLLNISTLIN